jgi:predicted nucleotidyltransferase
MEASWSTRGRVHCCARQGEGRDSLRPSSRVARAYPKRCERLRVRRSPALASDLDRLVSATGLELKLQVHRRASRLKGPTGASLWARRNKVKQLAAGHGLSNLRVFGSVARGEENEESDLDLLVDVTPGVGLIGLARAQHELEELLGTRVDLVPASDLKPGVAASVLAEAMPL